jgi:Uma2 family endonuclease
MVMKDVPFVPSNITILLSSFVQKHRLGRILVYDAFVYTRQTPNMPRLSEVAYISHERFSKIDASSLFAPELVVEVISPQDSWMEINDILEAYFELGVQLVWIINPQRKQVQVYTALTHLEIFNAQDTLTGGEVLPGLTILVADIFD